VIVGTLNFLEDKVKHASVANLKQLISNHTCIVGNPKEKDAVFVVEALAHTKLRLAIVRVSRPSVVESENVRSDSLRIKNNIVVSLRHQGHLVVVVVPSQPSKRLKSERPVATSSLMVVSCMSSSKFMKVGVP